MRYYKLEYSHGLKKKILEIRIERKLKRIKKRGLRYELRKKINEIKLKRILKRNKVTRTVRNEFQLNQFITLQLLDYGNSVTCTNVYVNDRKFPLYDFSFKEILEILNENNNYFCMDQACLDLIGTYNTKNFMGDPDTMFWIYCHYIDAWVKSNYDWRLLRVDDAFPILEALCRAGDLKARKVFKIEILKAFLSGYLPAVYYLLSSHSYDYVVFLNYFEFEDVIWLFEKCLKIVGFHNRRELKTQFFLFLQDVGIQNFNICNFKKSIKYLTEALKIYPDDLPTLQQLSEAYLKNGNFALAGAFLIYFIDFCNSKISSSTNINLNNYIVEAWCALGEVFNRIFLFDDAIIACNMAMNLDRDHVNTWDQIAIAYEGMGDFERAKDARKSFKKKVKIVIKNEREVQ